MITRLLAIGMCAVCATVVSYAQIGKITQQDWVTSRADAQRTSWIRGDIVISPEAMQKPAVALERVVQGTKRPFELPPTSILSRADMARR